MVNNQVNVGPLSVSYADSSPGGGASLATVNQQRASPTGGGAELARRRGAMVNNQVNVGPLSVSYADSSPGGGASPTTVNQQRASPSKGRGTACGGGV